MNCPYCQSNIKSDNEVQYCKECGTPHHKECWDENGGCTTYGCGQNPVAKKNKINLGNFTIEQIEELNNQEISSEDNYCIFCGGKIETDSVYCKHCGNKVVVNLPEKHSEEFIRDYQNRYKSKLKNRRNKYTIITVVSAVVLLFFIPIVYFGYTYIEKNYFSEEAKIFRFVSRWKKAWESKNTNKYEYYLDKDYKYIDKTGETINKEERMKRIKLSFKNIKNIRLELNDFEIMFDSTDSNYVNVKFRQNYISEKINEEGTKILRLYRGQDTDMKWKIYREWFESMKN
ncbi:MAG: hypothetical protein JW917_02755 [Ignavibacteria bacterium]|nr:hypothetical protein [Ignavibacteria bacterium]